GIGALERGHFIVDHHFELAGPREGAFEAVADGVDLAADGLADGGDLVGGGGFRLGKPHGGLGHRGGGETQILGAADEEGDGDHRQDGQRDDGGKRCEVKGLDEFGDRQTFDELIAVAHGGDDADADEPKDGGADGEPDGGIGSAGLGRIKGGGGGGAVVVGDGRRLGGDLVGGAQTLGIGRRFATLFALGRLTFDLAGGLIVHREDRVLECVFDSGERKRCRIVLWGGRLVRHYSNYSLLMRRTCRNGF